MKTCGNSIETEKTLHNKVHFNLLTKYGFYTPFFFLLLFLGSISGLQAEDTLFVYNKAYAGTVYKLLSFPKKNILLTGGGVIEYNPVNDSILKWYKPANSLLAGTLIRDYAYDSDSALWLCDNYNGVLKFDENDPVFYNKKNSPLGDEGIGDICTICFDKEGNLWIGTYGGLIVKWKDKGWETFTGDYFRWIYDIKTDSSGVVHIAGDRLILYDHNNWTFYNFSEITGNPNERVKEIFIASNGDIYYRGNKCFVKKIGNGIHILKLSDYDPSFTDFPYGIGENNSGDMYLLGIDGYVILKRDGTFSTISLDSLGIHPSTAVGVLHDRYRDRVYLGIVEKGMIDITDGNYDSICLGCNELSTRLVYRALYDHQNRLWVLGNKAAVLDNGQWNFFNNHGGSTSRNFIVTGGDEMLSNSSEYVWIYSNGVAYQSQVSISTGNGGLYEMTLGKDNYTYISTKIGLCYRKPFSNYWYKLENNGEYLDEYYLCSDTSGRIWFTHENGIGYFNPPDSRFTYFNPLNSSIPDGEEYLEIKCDSLNRIWLTVDSSIYIGTVDPQQPWKPFITLRDNARLKDVRVDSYGNTWLLTSDDLRFMNETDTLVFNKSDGMFACSAGFNNATVDADGIYWVAGIGGMTGFKYSQTGDVFNNKGKNRLSMKVYPNPATSRVFFELETNNPLPSRENILSVYNLYGQMITKSRFTGSKTALDMSSCPPGIYLYYLNNRMAGKLILR